LRLFSLFLALTGKKLFLMFCSYQKNMWEKVYLRLKAFMGPYIIWILSMKRDGIRKRER